MLLIYKLHTRKEYRYFSYLGKILIIKRNCFQVMYGSLAGTLEDVLTLAEFVVHLLVCALNSYIIFFKFNLHIELYRAQVAFQISFAK